MQPYTMLPEKKIASKGPIAQTFKALEIETFQQACRFVHRLPYGYNSDRDDLFILFKEKTGSCTTKHAVIATLADELDLPIAKHIGIYAMNEAIVTGTKTILDAYHLPYLPMVHCFLVFQDHCFDLTEGNRNGKNRPIDHFVWTETVAPNISAKDEYRRYRYGLTEAVMRKSEFNGIALKTVLKAREEGLILLRSKVGQ